MRLERIIRSSAWWTRAEQTADPHYPSDSGFTVAGHLLSVRRIVQLLLEDDLPAHPYVEALRGRLSSHGVSAAEVAMVLGPVALLHDIGKPCESKTQQGVHPLTGKTVTLRHPVVGAAASLELIPKEHGRRSLIAALVAKHGTGWSWYRQWTSRGQLPTRKAWRRLDRVIPAGEDGYGVLLLALCKLADVDGHADVGDVPWLLEQANESLLDDHGLALPVPSLDALHALNRRAGSAGVVL